MPIKRLGLWIAAIGILAGIILVARGPAVWEAGLRSLHRLSRPAAQSAPRAAIIDQVGFSHPNPHFVDLASTMLEVAGYQVDVFPGDEITVEFYRDLANQGHQLVVFRTHSSDVGVSGEIGLFTSEEYREDRWVVEQLRGRLAYGHIIPQAGGPAYFAILPAFVQKEMRGQFDDALLIVGGCESLATPQLAQALLDRGASAVVGWDKSVDMVHNDRAILRLLLAIVGEKMSLDEAVRRTMIEVGPDPVYGSRLGYVRKPGE